MEKRIKCEFFIKCGFERFSANRGMVALLAPRLNTANMRFSPSGYNRALTNGGFHRKGGGII